MSCNIGDDINLFLKLKTKLGLYHVELRSEPEASPENIMLTLVETQQLPDMERLFQKMKFIV